MNCDPRARSSWFALRKKLRGFYRSMFNLQIGEKVFSFLSCFGYVASKRTIS